MKVIAFGCKVSQVEAQAEREGAAGVDFLVQTCTVTETAAQEALREVRRIARRHPGARIRVTGCAAATHRQQFLAIPGVVEILPPGARDPWSRPISRLDGHTRAFLKVQDGCDLRCSFCIIPQVRGPSRQRPLDDALAEARRLVAAGHREIVLTGVHLGGFRRIPELVEQMLEIPVLARVRLSSIEIHEVTDALLDLMAAQRDRFCPHLHIPLQSGDAAILRAMRRRTNPEQFRRKIDHIRSRVPGIGLTTDVIAGFPGETREAFQRTLELCRWAGFHRIHAFSYSPRRGTDAARLADDVPRREKRRRVHELVELAAENARAFAAALRGQTVSVLIEDGTGYTKHYLRARAPGRPGELVTGRAGEFRDGVLEVLA